MRKAIPLAAAALGAFCFQTQGQEVDKAEFRVSTVAGNVYVLQGAGGNIGALVGADGVLLVDDESASMVDKLRAALRSITNKPVRAVINTHYHGDHVGGNAYFQQQAPVIAHDNVRRRLQTGGATGNGGSMHFETAPQPRGALPLITFDHSVTLHLDGEDVLVLHYPAGHTDGDSIVFFPAAKVVHMGDEFVTHYPFVDVEAGGSLNGMINAVEDVIARLPADAKVIPGHGPVSNVPDLRAYLRMLKETQQAVAGALKDGMTLEQMKQARILEPWNTYAGEFVTADAFLETIYISLTGRTLGVPATQK
jgi:cyclase